MYRFASGLFCGLIGFSALGLVVPGTGSNVQPSFESAVTVGATVNRAAKADRLQAVAFSSEAWKTEFNARIKGQLLNDTPMTPATKLEDRSVPNEMPVGCEPAVSAVLDDVLAKIPSRCLSSLFGNEILPG